MTQTSVGSAGDSYPYNSPFGAHDLSEPITLGADLDGVGTIVTAIILYADGTVRDWIDTDTDSELLFEVKDYHVSYLEDYREQVMSLLDL